MEIAQLALWLTMGEIVAIIQSITPHLPPQPLAARAGLLNRKPRLRHPARTARRAADRERSTPSPKAPHFAGLFCALIKRGPRRRWPGSWRDPRATVGGCAYYFTSAASPIPATPISSPTNPESITAPQVGPWGFAAAWYSLAISCQ